MKNQVVIALAFLMSTVSFAQKKELKAVEKAINRITSYNVCYTKLLRESCIISSASKLSLTILNEVLYIVL